MNPTFSAFASCDSSALHPSSSCGRQWHVPGSPEGDDGECPQCDLHMRVSDATKWHTYSSSIQWGMEHGNQYIVITFLQKHPKTETWIWTINSKYTVYKAILVCSDSMYGVWFSNITKSLGLGWSRSQTCRLASELLRICNQEIKVARTKSFSTYDLEGSTIYELVFEGQQGTV